MGEKILFSEVPDIIVGKGASQEDIEKAEDILKIIFSSDYREYLKKYGAVLFDGHELTGISKAKQLDVVSVTQEQRKYYTAEDAKDMYVIENLNIDGVIIWQGSDGTIYETQGNRKNKIYASFAEYIKSIIES